MSFCANVSELYRELRIAAGTVLTIVGSRLEADARTQVDVPVQWLTEFEAEREVIEPGYTLEALFDERARRYENSLTSTLTVRCGHCPAEFTGDSALATYYRHLADRHPDASAGSVIKPPIMPLFKCDEPTCECQDNDAYQASAAVPDAADPSPTVPNAHSVVGGEGSGGRLYVEQARQRKSDPGEVSPPSPGEQARAMLGAKNAAADAVKRWAEPPGRGLVGGSPAVVAGIAVSAYRRALTSVSEDDLAAHITAVLVDRPGCFLSDPQIGEFVASDLLADFHITKK